MKRITIVATLAVALGVGAAVAAASRAATAAPTMGEKNLVQTAIAAELGDLSILDWVGLPSRRSATVSNAFDPRRVIRHRHQFAPFGHAALRRRQRLEDRAHHGFRI